MATNTNAHLPPVSVFFSVGSNLPGCLPDGDVQTFATFDDAVEHARELAERDDDEDGTGSSLATVDSIMRDDRETAERTGFSVYLDSGYVLFVQPIERHGIPLADAEPTDVRPGNVLTVAAEFPGGLSLGNPVTLDEALAECDALLAIDDVRRVFVFHGYPDAPHPDVSGASMMAWHDDVADVPMLLLLDPLACECVQRAE